MTEVCLTDLPASSLGRSDRGAASELLACAALMRAGYHVFRAESPHAPFDLVAYRDGVCLRIEVKSITIQAKETYAPNFPWPKRDTWDLLAVVGMDRVFFFDSDTTVDEARDVIRKHYGYQPLSSTRVLQDCGTKAAYERHLAHGEAACAACTEAIRLRRQAASAA